MPERLGRVLSGVGSFLVVIIFFYFLYLVVKKMVQVDVFTVTSLIILVAIAIGLYFRGQRLWFSLVGSVCLLVLVCCWFC